MSKGDIFVMGKWVVAPTVTGRRLVKGASELKCKQCLKLGGGQRCSRHKYRGKAKRLSREKWVYFLQALWTQCGPKFFMMFMLGKEMQERMGFISSLRAEKFDLDLGTCTVLPVNTNTKSRCNGRE